MAEIGAYVMDQTPDPGTSGGRHPSFFLAIRPVCLGLCITELHEDRTYLPAPMAFAKLLLTDGEL